MYLFVPPWDTPLTNRGCFFYAKKPDDKWAAAAQKPDEKIKIVQRLTDNEKNYWTFIKNRYMIKTAVRRKKGKIERKDTS